MFRFGEEVLFTILAPYVLFFGIVLTAVAYWAI